MWARISCPQNPRWRKSSWSVLSLQPSAEMYGISSLCWKAFFPFQGPKQTEGHSSHWTLFQGTWLYAIQLLSRKHLPHQRAWWVLTCTAWPGAWPSLLQPLHPTMPCILAERHAGCAWFLQLSGPGGQSLHGVAWDQWSCSTWGWWPWSVKIASHQLHFGWLNMAPNLFSGATAWTLPGPSCQHR